MKIHPRLTIIIVLSVLVMFLVAVALVLSGIKPDRNRALETDTAAAESASPENRIIPEQDRAMTLVDPKSKKKRKPPAAEDKEEPGMTSEERRKAEGYKVLNMSRERSVAFFSDSGMSVRTASDYEIGKLLERKSGYGKAISAIRTLMNNMAGGVYPEDMFSESSAFYLNEKLKIELSSGIIPDQVHVGWPLINNENQINIPVKFIKNRGFASGEIIFEKQGSKWYIIEIAVDFSLLLENRPIKTYDDYFYYE